MNKANVISIVHYYISTIKEKIQSLLIGISLFIECHRNTLHIEHEESLHCLDLVKQQNDINNSHCNFRITQLQSTNQTLNPQLYEYTIDHCPNIRSLTITSPGIIQNMLRMHKIDPNSKANPMNPITLSGENGLA